MIKKEKKKGFGEWFRGWEENIKGKITKKCGNCVHVVTNVLSLLNLKYVKFVPRNKNLGLEKIVKCKTCGESIVLFHDGSVLFVLNKPRYGYTEFHICEAKGEYVKILSKRKFEELVG